MPSPYGTITAVTPTTGQIKATDVSQMVTAQPNLPQGLLGPVQTLAAATGTTTYAGSAWASEGLTGLSFTYTFPANRRIRVGWDGFANSTVTTDTINVFIGKDGVNSALAILTATTGGGVIFEDTPSAGSHTYEVRFARNSGTGAVSMSGGSLSSGVQAQFYVEDMGAV